MGKNIKMAYGAIINVTDDEWSEIEGYHDKVRAFIEDAFALGVAFYISPKGKAFCPIIAVGGNQNKAFKADFQRYQVMVSAHMQNKAYEAMKAVRTPRN